ncbi:type II methionyl aminopeptidase [Methanomassiliicoccus luminyensis]|jgi:methionyl aminopeptidase|uniref:type II methionyl aminopeptidase n=1 Tax=Methanomassiliicoccus luminyensis TaxID=1080712 RepID=UPI00035C8C6A|nr:type II methionyl aminopeptidase [Methanomassiliicoccus luminyensis]
MNDEVLEKVKRAGAIASEARLLGAGMVGEGVSLLSVAEEVEALIEKRGAKPAFPTNISINEVAAHYSPSTNDELKFSRGDLVKVDVGAHVDGYIGDTAQTVEVGTRNWGPLIDASAKGLGMAIEIVSEGVPIGALGGAIERGVKSNGYLPVTNLTGHSMQQYNLHAGISVANYDDGNLTRVGKDMILAIEPFSTNGAGEVRNSKHGNIYRIMRDRELRDEKAAEHFRLLKENFGTLPFCERWCTKLDSKAPIHLKTLVRHGLLFAYPMLSEVRGGMVAQTEHTVAVSNGKATVTTL